MKISSIAIFLILCISCTETNESSKNRTGESIIQNIIKSEFQTILDSADVIGSILIYDLNEHAYYSNDFEWAKRGNLPASTFKIANSIIGLETGVIENDRTIFKWDREEKWMKSWEQDLVLKDAFQFSCVPCYQDVARKVGVKRMNEWVRKINYGNLKIDSANIDDFWLGGASRISQMQQIDFLERFYNLELPISKSTELIIRNIMLFEETEQYKLSGKSGLSLENEKYNGWFVGYIELKNKTYLFATNLEPKNGFEFDTFVKKRLDLTLLALEEMNILN